MQGLVWLKKTEHVIYKYNTKTIFKINSSSKEINFKAANQKKQMTEINMEKTISILCKLIGHNWSYKDYSNWMKSNGDDYPFKASRYCSRCKQNQYLYKAWQAENQKSPHDLERDSQAVKQLSHLQTH